MDGYGNDVTMLDGDAMQSPMEIKITEVRMHLEHISSVVVMS